MYKRVNNTMNKIDSKILEFIKDNYSLLGNKKCCEILNISYNTCRHAAKLVGSKRTTKWTEEETQILINNKDKPVSEVSKLLPNRTIKTISANYYQKSLKRDVVDISNETRINNLDLIKNNLFYGITYCSEVTRLSKKTINSILDTHKLKLMYDTSKWKDYEIEYLLDNYLDIKQCCFYLKRSEDRISLKIKRMGLSNINNWMNKYRDIINLSNNECYLLGYLWSDGHVSDDRISLHIIKEDSIVIWNHINELNQNWKIIFGKKGNNMIVNNNVEFSRILKNYGFRNKSGGEPQNLLEKMSDLQLSYFYRGLFDGDGCIYLNIKNRSFQCVLNSCYEQTYNYLELEYNKRNIKYSIQRLIRKRINSKSSCIRIVNRKDILTWLNFIYIDKNNNSIGLKRKYDKYIDILKYDNLLNKKDLPK